MSDDRRKRVSEGCAKILTMASFLDDETVAAEAMIEATVAVLMTTMHDDRGLVAERLRRAADGLESERTGGMH
jgi:hypothetical protein